MNRCPITYTECGEAKYSRKGFNLLSGQLSQLEDIANNNKLGRLGFVPANDVMKIAYHVLAGQLAAKLKAYE